MRQLPIEKNDAGQRFDKFLAKYMTKAPKSFLYKMLRKKNIVLNGGKAEGSEKLAEGDIVTLYLSDVTIDEFRETSVTAMVPWNFNVLYEDENVLILDKPAGVLSQRAEKDDISLVEMLKSYLISTSAYKNEDFERFAPSVCNRLDRNTSGIVVAGKSLLGLQQMSKLFHDRTIDKYYYCIVSGQMTKKKNIRAYITKDTEKNIVMIVSEKESEVQIEAEYMPLNTAAEYTFLEVKLITGKTHQIRAHLASMGHPLIGDYKYGNRDINQIFKKKYGLRFQLLHAGKLVFPDLTGELLRLSGVTLNAELPEKFKLIKNENI